MAIEKTLFTALSTAENQSEVTAWVVANATEYFDSIEPSSGGVTCKIGGKDAFSLNWNNVNTERAFRLIAKNGTTIDNGFQFSNFNLCAWRYAYKTDSGIMLCNGDTRQWQTSIAISRNTENGVMFAAIRPNNTNYSTPANFLSILDFDNSNSAADSRQSSTMASGTRHFEMGVISAGRTALVPIVSDAGTYCENILYVPFTQYIDSCFNIIDVDGTKYVYNGVFALKE